MIEVTVRPMNWFVKAFLAVWAFFAQSNTIIGFTTYWKTVYIREGHYMDKRLLAHELTHVRQIHNLGWLKFTWGYAKEFFKNGYRNNRFEVEARHEAADRPIAVIESFKIINKLKV